MTTKSLSKKRKFTEIEESEEEEKLKKGDTTMKQAEKSLSL